MIPHANINIIEVKEDALNLIKHSFDFPQILETERLIRGQAFLKSPRKGGSISALVINFNSLFSLIKILLIDRSIGKKLKVTHFLMHPQKEVLNIQQLFILVDRIVDHPLPEPIHINDIMFQDMKIECSVEVAIVLKNLHIDVPDEVGGNDNDRNNNKEMFCYFATTLHSTIHTAFTQLYYLLNIKSIFLSLF